MLAGLLTRFWPSSSTRAIEPLPRAAFRSRLGAYVKVRFKSFEFFHDASIFQFRHGEHGSAEEVLGSHADGLVGDGVADPGPERMRNRVHWFGESSFVHGEGGTSDHRRTVEVTAAGRF